MRRALAISLALSLSCVPLLHAAPSANNYTLLGALTQDQYQDQGNYVPYSPEQLDNLLAPIALYPDPLLAQVLLAATFPDQIDQAARYVRSYGDNGIDGQPWDVSVRAVAHYPSVVYMMADNLDWTSAVGQAYVSQSTDVMSSVQRLRAMARAEGNLITGPQIEVVEQEGFIQIWPANPQSIYVPVYDPTIVYFARPFYGPAIGFSIGFIIGSWLNYDCDWHAHRIYYTGWRGSGWIARSRPYVHITNVYVDARYTNVNVNRAVVDRRVNFYNVNRYNNVHRNVTFDNHDRTGRVPRPDSRVSNQNINRNIPNDTRVNDFRGRASRPAPTAARPAQPGRVEQPAPPAQQRPVQPPAARPQAEQPAPHTFGRSEGQFPSREASQRGQASRASRPSPPSQAVPSRPASRPSPPSQAAPSRPAGGSGPPSQPAPSRPAGRTSGRPR
jgi:Protein of unknown function (DUF3300)